MDKLYLIRVGMERFLGPFTLKQVKEAYQRMEFGMQDEVAGSLRQWVSFDDFESIRRYYPELVQLVQREMLSGWGVSAQSALGNSDLPVKVRAPVVKRKSRLNQVFFALIILMAGAIGLLLYRDGQWNNILSIFKDRQLSAAQNLYGDRYNPRFEAFMDRNHDAINLALKRKKNSGSWLPFVRAVAFEKDGRWEGVGAKKLRGNAEQFLPADCSMASWDQRWLKSRELWNKYLDGREFPQQEWALLLAMDPHWILNRSPVAGWLSPGSYAEACLRMSLKSLQRQTSEALAWETKVFISRIRWQLGVINAKAPGEDFEMSGTLWALSCIEDSSDEAAMRNCMSSVNPKQGWKEVFDFATLRRRMFISVNKKTSIDASALEALRSNLEEFTTKTPTSLLPYEADIKFYQEIIQQQGNVNQAIEVMNQRIPQVNFAD